jgi:threonine synthase
LVEYDLDVEKGAALLRALPARPWTLWRYRELLPLADFPGRVDLGEGATPLVRLRRTAPPGVELWVKDESGNPTGSFKARGLSVAVNRARELGAPGLQLASAGNAALALSAYAAAAGVPARVALPADTPRTVFERCREYGAEVLSGPGTLVEAAKLLEAGAERFWTVSTLREPYRVEGKKTMGFELAEQLGWELPEWIVYPLGGGTGIVGMHKAFAELARLGLIGLRRPRFVVVQAAGCAPIVRAWEQGKETAEPWEDPRTRVWGLRVPRALADFMVLRAVRESGGRAVAVDESRLAEVAARAAARDGLRVGPEGAAALAAVEDLAAAGAFSPDERVVVFQTGDPANYV